MNPDEKLASVFTSPRSGTWWHLYFFYYYHNIFIGENNIKLPMEYKTVFDYNQSINHHFMVQHSICPGFEQRSWPFKEKWDHLNFSIPGYNGKHAALGLDPEREPDSRFVYIFRNPLDHFVSMFRHGQNHATDIIRTFIDSDNNKVALDSAFDFAMAHGVQCYIKQYITFQSMHALFPESVMMKPYEVITKDPAEHFRSLFAFFNIPIDEAAFHGALNRSSKDNMSKLENHIGGPIGGDQVDSSSRHIRDGSSGQWKDHFSAQQIDIIRDRFAEFDLDLNVFILE